MNKEQLVYNFSRNVERERIKLNKSQAEMAAALDLSLSTYKRIISGDTTTVDIYTAYKLYLLTQKLTYEYVDYSDDLVDVMSGLKHLNAEELHHVKELVNILLKNKEGLYES